MDSHGAWLTILTGCVVAALILATIALGRSSDTGLSIDDYIYVCENVDGVFCTMEGHLG